MNSRYEVQRILAFPRKTAQEQTANIDKVMAPDLVGVVFTSSIALIPESPRGTMKCRSGGSAIAAVAVMVSCKQPDDASQYESAGMNLKGSMLN